MAACHLCRRPTLQGFDEDKPETFASSGWAYACDDGWTCPGCRHHEHVRKVVHEEHYGHDDEHRFVVAGVVEARTRNWGIAKVFAETLARIAAEASEGK